MIPPARAVWERRYRKVVVAAGAQLSKTNLELNVAGHRLDTSPTPVMYTGPSRQFVEEQFEPRLKDMLLTSPSLRRKLGSPKRDRITRKLVAGVFLRLAHAGSSSALKSSAIGLALTDEADEMMKDVGGHGDPIALIDARGETFADFVHLITSTPSKGPADEERDSKSGLRFWKVQENDDVESPIWRLFQMGTRKHWTWQCPHCTEWFVPRFSCLRWEKPRDHHGKPTREATPGEAKRSAFMACPNNGCVITDEHKASMNAGGRYVAPGQWILSDGTVDGPLPDKEIDSYWISGLCTPFRTFGERAAAYVEALESGDQRVIQTRVNSLFGELWSPSGGDAPPWAELRRWVSTLYKSRELPYGPVMLTAGVDVQKDRLIYVVRGWGARGDSWRIVRHEIPGPTDDWDTWSELEFDLIDAKFGGLPVTRIMVDSGFRPNKTNSGSEHIVYDFARRHPKRVRAAKGYATRALPYSEHDLEVNAAGKKSAYSIRLARLDSDHFKSWVHQKLRTKEEQPGAFWLPSDTPDHQLQQLVSESRLRTASGKVVWLQRHTENHDLDCEALARAAAESVGVHRLTPDVVEAALEQMVEARKARAKNEPMPPSGGGRRGWRQISAGIR